MWHDRHGYRNHREISKQMTVINFKQHQKVTFKVDFNMPHKEKGGKQLQQDFYFSFTLGS